MKTVKLIYTNHALNTKSNSSIALGRKISLRLFDHNALIYLQHDSRNYIIRNELDSSIYFSRYSSEISKQFP